MPFEDQEYKHKWRLIEQSEQNFLQGRDSKQMLEETKFQMHLLNQDSNLRFRLNDSKEKEMP